MGTINEATLEEAILSPSRTAKEYWLHLSAWQITTSRALRGFAFYQIFTSVQTMRVDDSWKFLLSLPLTYIVYVVKSTLDYSQPLGWVWALLCSVVYFGQLHLSEGQLPLVLSGGEVIRGCWGAQMIFVSVFYTGRTFTIIEIFSAWYNFFHYVNLYFPDFYRKLEGKNSML